MNNVHHEFPVIGELKYDAMAQWLDTGYSRFECQNWHGLAKVSGNVRKHEIDVLAVATNPEGAGHFRRFVNQLKFEYVRVAFWAIENAVLQHALERYGFSPVEKDDIPLIPGSKPMKIRGMEWTNGR